MKYNNDLMIYYEYYIGVTRAGKFILRKKKGEKWGKKEENRTEHINDNLTLGRVRW